MALSGTALIPGPLSICYTSEHHGSSCDIGLLRLRRRLAPFGLWKAAFPFRGFAEAYFVLRPDFTHPHLLVAWLMNRKFFIGNLSMQTTEDELTALFADFGEVTDTRMMVEKTTAGPRLFAIVALNATPSDRDIAAELNGAISHDRRITVLEKVQAVPVYT